MLYVNNKQRDNNCNRKYLGGSFQI